MNRTRILAALLVAVLLVVALFLARREGAGASAALGAPANRDAEAGSSRDPERTKAPAERHDIAATNAVAAPSAPGTAGARLTVELVAAGRPASSGEVELHSGREEKVLLHASVDGHDGCARFESLPPGTYMISLAGLPLGLLPPRTFLRSSYPDDALRTVTMDGEDRLLRFELEPGVHVFGYVRTPDGQLARSMRLFGQTFPRVRCWRKSAGWGESVGEQYIDIVDGRYEGYVHEGLWVLKVDGGPKLDDAGTELPCVTPLPALRRLPPGSETQIDFQFRPEAKGILHVMVRDEEGKPFEGLSGYVDELHELLEPSTGESENYPWGGGRATRSLDTGELKISSLPRGRYRLWIEPEGYSPTSKPGVAKLGQVPPTSVLEFDGVEKTFEITIRRPRPVQVTGRIEVDSEWSRTHTAVESTAFLGLSWKTDREDVPVARENVQTDSGRFAFWLESSVKDPCLELMLAHETRRIPLTLVPDVTPDPLVIHFPR
jgi:hypothetical protein